METKGWFLIIYGIVTIAIVIIGIAFIVYKRRKALKDYEQRKRELSNNNG